MVVRMFGIRRKKTEELGRRGTQSVGGNKRK